jgi:hypothetical protein
MTKSSVSLGVVDIVIVVEVDVRIEVADESRRRLGRRRSPDEGLDREGPPTKAGSEKAGVEGLAREG